jgi:hypothetical protein
MVECCGHKRGERTMSRSGKRKSRSVPEIGLKRSKLARARSAGRASEYGALDVSNTT